MIKIAKEVCVVYGNNRFYISRQFIHLYVLGGQTLCGRLFIGSAENQKAYSYFLQSDNVLECLPICAECAALGWVAHFIL